MNMIISQNPTEKTPQSAPSEEGCEVFEAVKAIGRMIVMYYARTEE
jgi:hypothetical protein